MGQNVRLMSEIQGEITYWLPVLLGLKDQQKAAESCLACGKLRSQHRNRLDHRREARQQNPASYSRAHE